MENIEGISYFVRINRQDVDPSAASVSIFDHGFLFGDSIYEVIRTVKGKPLAWTEHLARLRNSARRLSLELPWTDDELTVELETTLRAARWSGETYVRLIVTRGVGEIDLMPTTCKTPILILIAKPIPEPPPDFHEKGFTLCVTNVRRNSRQAMDPGIKSGNYLNNVLAMIEARSKGADDAVMLNEHGYLTECTTSNIFLIKDGVVFTPGLESGILPGITRDILISTLEKAGLSVEETDLTITDLASADEIFMTGSIKGVVPVREIVGLVEWSPGAGTMTGKIKTLYDNATGLTEKQA
jgi:branched-chain amino acid aminotransferase